MASYQYSEYFWRLCSADKTLPAGSTVVVPESVNKVSLLESSISIFWF